MKDLPVPDFGSLQAWEARANAAGLLNGESGGNDPNRANQGQGYGGTPMPYLGETKVTFQTCQLLIFFHLIMAHFVEAAY